MDVAALIIAIIALLLSIFTTVILVAKEYFSSHVIQYKSVEDLLNPSEQKPGRRMDEPYKEIGDPLSEEELEYFKTAAQVPFKSKLNAI